jgi:hypothetical protein
MTRSSRWQPGRLIVGWALGVLTTIGLVTLMGGWYEYRQLSNAPGSQARRVSSTDSACQVDREGAINIGGFAVVPRQDDPCYLRRPRIRPWQWMDGIRDQIGRLTGAASATPSRMDRPETVLAAATRRGADRCFGVGLSA